MANIEGSKARGVAKYTYDFSKLGGTVGGIELIGNDLPSKAVIYGGVMDVITAPTSGGSATIAVSSAEAENDLINAAAISGAPWSTTGIKAIIPVSTAATSIKLTAARHPKAVVGTAALTAGKFNLFLHYFLSD